MHSITRPRLAALVAVLVVAAGGLGLTACGSSSGGNTAPTTSTTNKASSSLLKTAADQVALLYSGDLYSLPTGTVPKPPKGKNIWAISYGQASLYAAEGAKAMQEAGKKLGWKVRVWDGKYDPNQWLAGIRAATANGANAIWLYTVDCAPVKAAIDEARKAGVEVIISAAQNCGPTGQNGVYDVHLKVGYDDKTGIIKQSETDPISTMKWNRAWGAGQGWWTLAKTNGKVKAISFRETDCPACIAENEGFNTVIKLCPQCELWEVPFTGTDFGGNKLQQKAQQALIQHPDANVVNAAYDTPVTSGIAAAVKASGRKLLLLGGEGDPPNVDLVYEGVQSVGTGYDPGYEAWCAVDAMISRFGGQEPRACGIGFQFYDKDHNLPPKGQAFKAPVDYQSAFLKQWGIQ